MFTTLSFTLEVGPIVEGDLVAGRWTGRGVGDDGEVSFFGNAIAGLGEQQRRGRINAVSG